MKNFLKRLARTLYQVFVVGIILLPFRLVEFVFLVLAAVLAPVVTKQITIKECFEVLIDSYISAYKDRAQWVKEGNKMFDEYDYDSEDETA